MRVLFIGAQVDSLERPEWSLQERFERSGHNTGNLLIGSALRRQIAATSWGTNLFDPAIDDKFDLIAIPAANFIFRGFDLGWIADLIEKTSLPCLMVGLGAQAPTTADAALEIPAGTRRFLEIVAERTHSIGVRGEFTAEVLARLQIDNVTVTGCPSLYWTLEPELRIAERPYRPDLAISINGSRNVTAHASSPADAAALERRLIELAVAGGYDYVLQNELPELLIAFDEGSEEAMRQLEAVIRTLGLSLTADAFAAFLSQRGRAFFSVERWSEYIRQRDFSLGTRFHGNLIALLNGVPAVVIIHDSRTRELCEWSHIPHIALDAALLDDIGAIYEGADYVQFASRYSELYRHYVEFLTGNGVPTNLIRT